MRHKMTRYFFSSEMKCFFKETRVSYNVIFLMAKNDLSLIDHLNELFQGNRFNAKKLPMPK